MPDVLISGLGLHAALAGTDLFEIEQAGPSSKYLSLTDLLAYISDNLAAPDLSEAVTDLSIVAGVVTIDLNDGRNRNFRLSLTANVISVVFTNLPASPGAAWFDLEIKQDATGGRTFAIPGTLKALGGSDTAIAAGANAVTVLSAKTFDNGATWRYAMQESA